MGGTQVKIKTNGGNLYVKRRVIFPTIRRKLSELQGREASPEEISAASVVGTIVHGSTGRVGGLKEEGL